METTEKLYINEVLCYVSKYFHSSTKEQLCKTIERFYITDELIKAKKILYEIYPSLGKFPQRKTSTVRSENSAHSEDIVQAIINLDGEKKECKFGAVNLDRIPRCSPNETELFAVAEKLSVLETKLNMLEFSVCENKNECSQAINDVNNKVENSYSKLENRIDTITKSQSTYADMVKNSNKEDQKMRNNTFNGRVDKIQRRPINTESQNEMNHTVLHATGNSEISRSVSESNHVNIGKSNLSVRKKPKLIIRGSGNNDTLKGAPPPKRDFFVYRVDSNVTSIDLESFLNDNSIKFNNVDKVSKSESKFNSFRLTVPYTEQDKILNDSFWPSGVLVRKFYEKKTAIGNDRNINHNSAINSIPN